MKDEYHTGTVTVHLYFAGGHYLESEYLNALMDGFMRGNPVLPEFPNGCHYRQGSALANNG
ncbi:MAG TPA: hypothetical protein VL527_08450 [Dongiaceae bacterium]|nr:hypothetical protein [Dongiaceae bacterium]